MAAAPLPRIVPPAWTNQEMVLYHGTTLPVANAIVRSGVPVDSTQGSHRTDFGQGFYTTTVLRQAQTWAWERAQPAGLPGSVIEFRVGRDALAALQTMSFALGDFEAVDFWSFVFHCRSGHRNHGRVGTPRYDLVVGPVSAFWQQRLVLQGTDQISFHTPAATRILNAAHKATIHV